MFRAPPVQTEPDPSGVRQRIVAAASTEFAARGYAAASVRTIAKRAGTTAAMINYYFGGKQALYDRIVDGAMDRLLARLARAFAEGDGTGVVERLALAHFDFLVEERDLQRLLLWQMLDPTDADHRPAAEAVRPLRRLLEEHFGDGARARQVAISIFGAIAGYFLYAPALGPLLGRDPLSPKSLTERRRHVAELSSLMERSMG